MKARSHGLVVKADEFESRLAGYYIRTMKIMKTKVAKWGTPKKIF